MFEQSMLVNSVGKGRKAWTMLVSFLVQGLILILLVLVPLVFSDALPMTALAKAMVFASPPPPPPPPPAPTVSEAPKVATKPKVCTLCAPKEIPKRPPAEIKDIDEPPPPQNTVANNGVPGGIPGGVPGSTGAVIAGIPKDPPPPPPPAPKQEEKPKPPQQPIRVGGNVQAANLIKKVTPYYPQLAKASRTSGTVRFSAVIGKDGTIQNLQVVSGHPLLVAAATEAVKQWVYKPTLLNNEPVEVITQIDVNFTLTN